MNEKNAYDIICNVLANSCSLELIYNVLNEFIPGYEKLNLNYICPPDNEEHEFKSENEMVQYFIANKNISQTFYWNKYSENPDNIMVGAKITDDNKLVMSLTFNGTSETEEKYYLKLKKILKSDIGVISYIDPPEYTNGNDFIYKYGTAIDHNKKFGCNILIKDWLEGAKTITATKAIMKYTHLNLKEAKRIIDDVLNYNENIVTAIGIKEAQILTKKLNNLGFIVMKLTDE